MGTAGGNAPIGVPREVHRASCAHDASGRLIIKLTETTMRNNRDTRGLDMTELLSMLDTVLRKSMNSGAWRTLGQLGHIGRS